MATTTELETLVVRLVGDDSKYQKMLKDAEMQTKKSTDKITKQWKNSMKKVGDSMTSAGVKMTAGVSLPVVGMIKSFASFDDAMTKSTAIMGNVSTELRKEMETTARSISLNSVTSATQAAESYFFLASAGMDAVQSIKALPVVERFAVAGAFDMAQATDLLTDAQSALGLSSKDASENMAGLSMVSDILVKANTLANASVQQFSEALTNEAGAAIRQYNMDLREGVAILATYADQGLKGNVAGSMMARMTRLLIKSINENKGAFQSMNIDVEEFSKTGRNLTGVIEGITKAVDGMGPAAKAAALEQLGFQARVQQAILPLLGATDKIREYEKGLMSAGGITKEVADKQMTSLTAQLKILWNRITDVGISIGKELAPFVKLISDFVGRLTAVWRGLNKETQKTVAIVLGVLGVMGPLLLMTGFLIKAVLFVASAFGVLASILVGTATKAVLAFTGALTTTISSAIMPFITFIYGSVKAIVVFASTLVGTGVKSVVTFATSIVSAAVTSIVIFTKTLGMALLTGIMPLLKGLLTVVAQGILPFAVSLVSTAVTATIAFSKALIALIVNSLIPVATILAGVVIKALIWFAGTVVGKAVVATIIWASAITGLLIVGLISLAGIIIGVALKAVMTFTKYLLTKAVGAVVVLSKHLAALTVKYVLPLANAIIVKLVGAFATMSGMITTRVIPTVVAMATAVGTRAVAAVNYLATTIVGKAAAAFATLTMQILRTIVAGLIPFAASVTTTVMNAIGQLTMATIGLIAKAVIPLGVLLGSFAVKMLGAFAAAIGMVIAKAIIPLSIAIGGVAVKAVMTLLGALAVLGKAILAPFLILLAKAAAIIGVIIAIGMAFRAITGSIAGQGGFQGALMSAWETMKRFAMGVLGFLQNIRHNFQVLMEWIPENWWNILVDMLNMILQFGKNMAHNYGVVLMTLIKLSGFVWAQIAEQVKWLFSVEFVKWAWEGIKQVGKAIADFAKNAWETLKGIFTGEGSDSELAQKAAEAAAKIGNTVKDAFNEGAQANSISDIIGKQMDSLKGPIEGFQSTISEAPKFKTDVDTAMIKKYVGKVKSIVTGEGFTMDTKGINTEEIEAAAKAAQGLTIDPNLTAGVSEEGQGPAEARATSAISSNMSLASLFRGREQAEGKESPEVKEQKKGNTIAQKSLEKQDENNKKMDDLITAVIAQPTGAQLA